MKIHYALTIFVVLLASFIPLSVAEITPSLLSITDVSPSSLSPGESTMLKITVENVGDSDAENVIISWTDATNSILPVGVGNTVGIGTLSENEEETAEFDITTDVAAAPGLYQIAITMTYSINGTAVVQNANGGIKIGGDTTFEIIVSDVEFNKISLSILNVGNNPAKAVTVTVPKQDGYEPIGGGAISLGKLASDDYVIVPFDLKVKDSTKDLKIEIDYTDTDGARKSVDKTIDLEQYQIDALTGANLPKESSGTAKWVGIFIVAALIVLGIYFHRRRKKKYEID